jgi:hypothetical protein
MAFRCVEYPLILKCFGPGTNEIVDGVTPSRELFIPCVKHQARNVENLFAMYRTRAPGEAYSLRPTRPTVSVLFSPLLTLSA